MIYNTWSVTFQLTCEELLRLLLCVFILQNSQFWCYFTCCTFKVLVNFTSNAFLLCVSRNCKIVPLLMLLLCASKFANFPIYSWIISNAFAVCLEKLQIFPILMLLLFNVSFFCCWLCEIGKLPSFDVLFVLAVCLVKLQISHFWCFAVGSLKLLIFPKFDAFAVCCLKLQIS